MQGTEIPAWIPILKVAADWMVAAGVWMVAIQLIRLSKANANK